MKRILSLLILCFVCGCGSKQQDARIANLEANLSTVEANCLSLSNKLNDLIDASLVVNSNGMVLVSNVIVDLQRLQQEYEKVRLGMLELSVLLTNTPPAQPARYGNAQPMARAKTPASRDGVPIAAYNEIAAEAARKWGNDYDMQDYEIRKQVEAYKKLHP